ncbi:hypothetical protein IMSAGC007_01762 [Lachnospiraceae bacterium]|nr:hypothetical protein IMSAGC007_01762 [Lachnospiraceae bacterium]
MKISVKNQQSDLDNEDIKWYLLEEKLWITKHNEYAEIENSIEKSVGSFNWLYEINDTILFSKKDKRFETAIIDLSGKIRVSDLESAFVTMKKQEKGEVFFAEEGNCDFQFSSEIIYIKDSDVLAAYSANPEEKMAFILLIADDFGFVINNAQLEGWVLKNASKHICISQPYRSMHEDGGDLLEKYLNALNLWEEDEESTTELRNLLENIKTKSDLLSLAVKESIINIL